MAPPERFEDPDIAPTDGRFDGAPGPPAGLHRESSLASLPRSRRGATQRGLSRAQRTLKAYGDRFLRPQEEPVVDLATIILAAVVYGALYLCIGRDFLPGRSAWATLLLWASAQVGALIAHYCYMPRVVGMLAAGLILRNVPWNAVTAFKSSWGSKMRGAALGTIFLRCGLELDFNTMKRYKYPAARLALIPGLAEAFFDGGIASTSGLFNMPILLAFTMGFILKAVGPGLVVPAMFKLQKEGRGKDQGIPSTVVISASFDDVIAITGYAVFSHIAITGQGNIGWPIAQGPMQVVFGIVGGLLIGIALSYTRIFDTLIKRIVGMYGGTLLLMFFLMHFDMLSGGAIGALFLSLCASHCWEKGFCVPRCLSLGPSLEFPPEMERYLAIIWNWVMEPMLFVTIGQSIHFKSLPDGTIGKSILIVCVGLCLRAVITFVCMMGMGYTWKERLFFAVTWTPKATIQASLSSAPLGMIQKYKRGASNYAEWEQWGYDILVTGVFAIIICGTLGLIAIHFLAPHLLLPAAPDPEAAEGSHRGDDELDPEGADADLRASGGDAKRGSEMVVQRTRSLPVVPSEPPLRRPAHDYELVALYIDTIRQLTTAATATNVDQKEVQRLSDAVMAIQSKIELDVGRRDLTVRELFRTAAFMANEEFVVRHGILPGNPPSSVAPATAPESRESFSVVRHSDNSSHKK